MRRPRQSGCVSTTLLSPYSKASQRSLNPWPDFSFYMLSSSVCSNSPVIRRCSHIKYATDRMLSKQENQPNKVRACILNQTDKTLAYFILTVNMFHVINRTPKWNNIDTSLIEINNFASLRNLRPTFKSHYGVSKRRKTDYPLTLCPILPEEDSQPHVCGNPRFHGFCRCCERFDPLTGDILSWCLAHPVLLDKSGSSNWIFYM